MLLAPSPLHLRIAHPGLFILLLLLIGGGEIDAGGVVILCFGRLGFRFRFRSGGRGGGAAVLALAVEAGEESRDGELLLLGALGLLPAALLGRGRGRRRRRAFGSFLGFPHGCALLSPASLFSAAVLFLLLLFSRVYIYIYVYVYV
jgi:hypothetical protein